MHQRKLPSFNRGFCYKLAHIHTGSAATEASQDA